MILLNKLQGNIVFAPKSKLSGDIQTAKMQIAGNIIYNGRVQSGTEYEGPYEVTPSQEQCILYTENKIMIENLIVKPIPDNYGLITWNGSYLRIS